MVVDDSAVVRGLWARIVDGEADMRVVASAWDGQAALDVLGRKPVDVVLLDVEMPGMDGLTALPLMLAAHPDVRVVMASTLTRRGAEVTVRALALGAADYVTKPVASGIGPDMRETGADLVRKIRALVRGRAAVAPGAGPLAPAVEPRRTPWLAGREPPVAVGITSSTGGPNALHAVLTALPADFPLPILIAQHMPAVFTAMLAERLAHVTGRPCREATDGEAVAPGCAYVAPGGRHMVVERAAGAEVLRLTTAPPENFCRPSADPLFRSLASAYGPALLAVVLTGMGKDGLEGSRAVRAAGGWIVAQDAGTSVVWGMPGAVVREGLADAVLPLGAIAPHIGERAKARR